MTEPRRRETREDRRRGPDGHRWGGAYRRGQSTALDYTLALGIAAVLVTGLFAATGDFVTSQREDVVRTELGVVGEQLANKFVAADRLVQSNTQTTNLLVNASMPRRVAGASYNIEIEASGGSHWLELTATNPDVSVNVKLNTETDIEEGRYEGGPLEIQYDQASDSLEVRR